MIHLNPLEIKILTNTQECGKSMWIVNGVTKYDFETMIKIRHPSGVIARYSESLLRDLITSTKGRRIDGDIVETLNINNYFIVSEFFKRNGIKVKLDKTKYIYNPYEYKRRNKKTV